jgi:hypothetical protein
MNLLRGEKRLARRTDSSAVLVVPNVKLRIEAQYSVPRLSLRDLLWENFTFYTQCYGTNRYVKLLS